MGRKQKHVVQRSASRPSLLIQLGLIGILAFIPTCASMAVFPATTRVVAPLVCPADTDHSVVMARWGGTTKGGSSLKSELYCVTSEGFGTIPSTGKVVLALGVIYGGLAGVLILLVGMWLRVRIARRSRGGQAHA